MGPALIWWCCGSKAILGRIFFQPKPPALGSFLSAEFAMNFRLPAPSLRLLFWNKIKPWRIEVTSFSPEISWITSYVTPHVSSSLERARAVFEQKQKILPVEKSRWKSREKEKKMDWHLLSKRWWTFDLKQVFSAENPRKFPPIQSSTKKYPNQNSEDFLNSNGHLES